MYECLYCNHVTDQPNKAKKDVTITGRTFIKALLVCPMCGSEHVYKIKK